MKRKQKLYSFLTIALVGFISWYFFLKEYTYEFEVKSSLRKNQLIELLAKKYPDTHPHLILVEEIRDQKFVFRFFEADYVFVQEIEIKEISNQESILLIGVNAERNFFKERFYALYKETVLQVYNRFLLLQLTQEIDLIEKAVLMK